MSLKPNLRSRNIALNSYVGMLVVTIVASLATIYIIHVAIDVPFAVFVSPATYAIDSSW